MVKKAFFVLCCDRYCEEVRQSNPKAQAGSDRYNIVHTIKTKAKAAPGHLPENR